MQFTVNIDVDDLDRAVDFYSAAFGLNVGRRFGAYAVELVGGPAPIYLLAKEAGSTPHAGASAARSYARHWTPVHLDVVVDAIEPAVERAVAAGARLEKPAAAYRWGKLALMADPFGHGFCFIEFLGRGYDEIAE
ncbi:MAG TPA: VOC family protein [Burkholderiales bacterium]